MELTAGQRTNLKRTGIAIAVLVLASVGSFTAGRFSAPLEVKTLEIEKIVYKSLTTEDITRGMSFTKSENRTVYRNVVTTVYVSPDAGTTTTIADNSIEHVGALEEGSVTETEARTEIVTAEREVLREKIVTLRPDWRVSGLVGASIQPPFVPIAGPLVFGLSGERRIIGGVSAGLWINTFGAIGAVVSGEF